MGTLNISNKSQSLKDDMDKDLYRKLCIKKDKTETSMRMENDIGINYTVTVEAVLEHCLDIILDSLRKLQNAWDREIYVFKASESSPYCLQMKAEAR
ncbi:13574_t:CDS:2 [Funneliformis mosseae]|uniref:13574_t:CDS:1 n=1 Tax=Funneliformis mosseae TaxID=27381 RepID=A0A9N8UZ32_FUNMO|nr:13574_t:CDS:2 [Funneliformis mosseae]